MVGCHHAVSDKHMQGCAQMRTLASNACVPAHLLSLDRGAHASEQAQRSVQTLAAGQLACREAGAQQLHTCLYCLHTEHPDGISARPWGHCGMPDA